MKAVPRRGPGDGAGTSGAPGGGGSDDPWLGSGSGAPGARVEAASPVTRPGARGVCARRGRSPVPRVGVDAAFRDAIDTALLVGGWLRGSRRGASCGRRVQCGEQRSGPGLAAGDSDRLAQVFTNLLGNALTTRRQGEASPCAPVPTAPGERRWSSTPVRASPKPISSGSSNGARESRRWRGTWHRDRFHHIPGDRQSSLGEM